MSGGPVRKPCCRFREWLQKAIAAKEAGDDVLYRRRDHVALVNRRPLAKLREAAWSGMWIPDELAGNGLMKQVVLAELAATAPGGAADVQ